MTSLLASILLLLGTHLTSDAATQHAAAATTAATAHDLDPEMLLAMAYLESRYDYRALSYRKCHKGSCKRTTTLWDSDKRPSGAAPSWFCGVMQVGGHVSWARCRELQGNIEESYMVGAQHVRDWMADPVCARAKNPLVCALDGYGGGYKAARKGSRYSKRVLAKTAEIKKLVEAADNS